jgi:hypothetical protein
LRSRRKIAQIIGSLPMIRTSQKTLPDAQILRGIRHGFTDLDQLAREPKTSAYRPAEMAAPGNLEWVVAKSGRAASQPNGDKAPRLS